MNLDEVICSCYQVTAGMIKDAVESGADTLAKVQEETNAGTACGACLDRLEEVVAHFITESGK